MSLLLQRSTYWRLQPRRQNQWWQVQRKIKVMKVTMKRKTGPRGPPLNRLRGKNNSTHVSDNLAQRNLWSTMWSWEVVVKNNVACVISTARCQISDESKDEEIRENEKKEKESSKAEKTTPSLASLNSNYRESSSSGSESNERVRYYKYKTQTRVLSRAN